MVPRERRRRDLHAPEVRGAEGQVAAPRILHVGLNTGGDAVGLSRGERALGFVSDVMVFDAHPFGYEHDIEIGLAGVSDRRGWARRFAAVARAALRYDVIHYEYGYTIAQRLHYDKLQTELPLMKRLGKTIISQWHGDDARPPSANPWGFQEPEYLAYMEAIQAPRRELMLRHCDRTFFVNPDLRDWLPGGRFRPYASVDVRAIEPVPPPAGEGEEVTVIHAPSHRGIKGTEFIERAVAELRGEGVKLKLDLVEGVSHPEAMRRFAAADFAVDQLHIGWYGGFALEAMALGKPVICHIEDGSPEDNPFGEELPIVRATPETVKEAIRGLATDRARRLSVGAASRAFAEARHDPRTVAREVLDGLVPIPSDR